MKIKGLFQEYEVKVNKTQYYNGNLAITLDCYDDEYNFWEPYGNLTVNLDKKLPPNQAYVDTNNMPNAEAFIAEYNLGEPTGEYGFSGFCCYPLYRFYESEVIK